MLLFLCCCCCGDSGSLDSAIVQQQTLARFLLFLCAAAQKSAHAHRKLQHESAQCLYLLRYRGGVFFVSLVRLVHFERLAQLAHQVPSTLLTPVR